ncbi:hypothetical protein [Streptomyces davaonensis]|uniref:hypothetical protein n=1 Tax=Streptomyces davaonensis TaxID=348043 RepID=UPI00138B0D9C|nr:hypothetical protein [Streptomyces davaonensis]
MTYMLITRPAKPPATWVERQRPSSPTAVAPPSALSTEKTTVSGPPARTPSAGRGKSAER